MEVGNDILPKTLVLGASQKPERYSYLAIRSLRKHGIEVVAIGARKGMVDDIEIHTELQDIPDIHTITLYLSARNQAPYYNYIINLKPKRLILTRELKTLIWKNLPENMELTWWRGAPL